MKFSNFDDLNRFASVLQDIPCTPDSKLRQLVGRHFAPLGDKVFVNLNGKTVQTQSSTSITCFGDDQYVVKAMTPKEICLALFNVWLAPKTLKDIDWATDSASDDNTYFAMMAASFKSYAVAFAHARQETGLIAIHLRETKEEGIFFLDDESHSISRTPFLVQERAELLQDRIKRQINSGPDGMEQAKASLDEILHFIIELWRKGISDESHRYHDSFGWSLVTGKPIISDIGELSFSMEDAYSQVERDDLHNRDRYHDGRRWLEEKYPELAKHLLQSTMNLFTTKHVFG